MRRKAEFFFQLSGGTIQVLPGFHPLHTYVTWFLLMFLCLCRFISDAARILGEVTIPGE